MKDIVEKIFSAGVVGAGGAGFPTHVKAQCKADMIIANGAECEPLLCNDKVLMQTRTQELLRGLSIMAKATGASRTVIALKQKYTDIIEKLRALAPSGVEIFELQDYYPAGDEQEIVNNLTNKIVPETGIPPDVGVVTVNIETLINVAASAKNQPVTHRYVSVLGEVRTPAVYHVPIGTSVQTVIESATGATCENITVILGGTMMGTCAESLNVPVTKTVGAVFVLPASHPVAVYYAQRDSNSLHRALSACTQCTLCTDVCSRHLLGHRLLPHKIMLLQDLAALSDSWLLRSVWLCSECGCCEYACPLMLSPRRVIRKLKDMLRRNNVRFDPSGFVPQVQPERELRHIPVDRLITRLGLQQYQGAKVELSEKRIDPLFVTIPLKQHAGISARAIVKKQHVKRGELIATIPSGQLGANLHASMDGCVTQVTKDMIRIEAE